MMRRVWYCMVLFGAVAGAQSPTLTLNSIAIQMDPQGTDTYTIQGVFNGISFANAQAVTFQVGQFSGTIPVSQFARQPGANVLTYQDSTGFTPYWISSLSLDLDAQTFTAQASGIVLAGLANPFAVQLGAGQGSGCTMARVQGIGGGAYQLNAGDGANEPCSIAAPPAVQPIFAGVETNVSFQVSILPTPGLDPQSIQLYRADDNGQTAGDSLCLLTDQGGGTYSCTATFNEQAARAIPLLVQATAAGQTILSPGFSLQVVRPADDSDTAQISAIDDAMSGWQQNFDQFGDSPHARILTLAALRQAMQPPTGLTSSPAGLALDGLSIEARADFGGVTTLVLNAIAPAPDNSSSAAQAKAARLPRASYPDLRPRWSVHQNASLPPPECGQYQRDIVQNNQVLIWNPGFIFFGGLQGGQDARRIAPQLSQSKCPSFDQSAVLNGMDANLSSLDQFPNYGTIIMQTHSLTERATGRTALVTGDLNINPWHQDPRLYGRARVVYFTNPGQSTDTTWDYFLAVYPGNPHLHALQNTVIFGGFCFSDALSGSFAPAGSKSAFFGYDHIVRPNVTFTIDGPLLFGSLINDYNSAAEAVAGLPPLVSVQLRNSPNLAYVGNPHLALTNLPPAIGGSQVLAAFLEGTASCGMSLQDYVNVKWTSHAVAGHLNSKGDRVSGSQDNFTNLASCTEAVGGCSLASVLSPPAGSSAVGDDWALAEYTPDATLPGDLDSIVADFYPNPAGSIAARGCLSVRGNVGLFVTGQLATIWDDSNPAQREYEAAVVPPVKVTGAYAVPFTDPAGVQGKGATASVTIISSSPGNFTLTLKAGGANPNYNAAKTVGSGLGPYHGLAQIELLLVNPGAAGKAQVKIDGTVNNPALSQTVGSPPRTLVTQAGGTLSIFDSQGKILMNGSLDPLDPNAIAQSFSVKAGSDCSGSALSGNALSCGVRIGVSLGEDLIGAPSPATFSVTLNIQFMTQ
jgi:hypothetical protein